MIHRTTTQLNASYYAKGNSVICYKGGDTMAKKKSGTSGTYKVGRDAKNGQFITVKQAERRKSTAIVETMKKKK